MSLSAKCRRQSGRAFEPVCRRRPSIWLTCCLVGSIGYLSWIGQARAQIVERNISMDVARLIIDGALEECARSGYNVVVTVVDRAGDVKGMQRHDSTHPHNIELSRRKAYTSRTFRQTTEEFRTRTDLPESSGLRSLPGVIWAAGGVPIKIGEDTIGAVGVSGAPGGPRDEICAKAGIAKVVDRLK
jgi:uncharacterized protein GlcG (DUF336 family)